MLNIFTGNTGANAELVLLKIDYEACLIQTQRAYEKNLSIIMSVMRRYKQIIVRQF